MYTIVSAAKMKASDYSSETVIHANISGGSSWKGHQGQCGRQRRQFSAFSVLYFFWKFRDKPALSPVHTDDCCSRLVWTML